MRCPRCNTENSESRRFCRECGSFIANTCRSCGFNNSLTDKYCGGCGTNLLETTAPGKKGIVSQMSQKGSGKYSSEDITELIEEDTGQKKRDIKKQRRYHRI